MKGVKIVAISDVTGGYYNKNGIDVKQSNRIFGKIKSLEGGNFGEFVTNEELLEIECDILVPAAKERSDHSTMPGKVK